MAPTGVVDVLRLNAGPGIRKSERLLELLQLVALDHILFLIVVELTKLDTALESVLHFLHVVLEAVLHFLDEFLVFAGGFLFLSSCCHMYSANLCFNPRAFWR